MSEYPVDEYLTILSGIDVRKSGKWWTAILKVHPKDRPDSISVRIYRWQKRGDKWKKVSSLNINKKEDWEKIKEVVDRIIATSYPQIFREEGWDGEVLSWGCEGVNHSFAPLFIVISFLYTINK